MTEEMGFDAAVDYKGENLREDLAAHCPDGIDFFSDAIGGAVTAAAIPLMKQGAPWYHYGNLSTYDAMVPDQQIGTSSGMSPEVLRLCEEKSIHPSFLLVFDYYSQRLRAEEEMADYLRQGKLKAPVTTEHGLDKLPKALVDGTFGGQKYGKLNVRLAA